VAFVQRSLSRKESERPFRVATRSQCRQIDVAATERFFIPSIVLMENAARALAAVSLEILEHDRADVAGGTVVICGAGNNGGDGYAAARHLHNAGCAVTIIALAQPRPESDADRNAETCRRMNLAFAEASTLGALAPKAALIIDAIFGTGLDRDVTGLAAHVIAILNEFARPVVAADIPSGLDAETGHALGEAVQADVTVSFAALKPGLLRAEAQPFVGQVIVAGIGAPLELIHQHSTPVDPHALAAMGSPPKHFDPHLSCALDRCPRAE
jgi:NAD(P)H-hydrate epimerase